ncbi:Protein FAM110C [Frankliniella fusca]|uniref:Protein FAM110C n=1 Tax=Frankliniella fusca TaxID=407009 RepID=A0AAE1HZ75_9NEOP|nr:Protein FAM110C [Frankliniella fusca]
MAVRAERLQLCGHGGGGHGAARTPTRSVAVYKQAVPAAVPQQPASPCSSSPSPSRARALRPLNALAAAKRKSAVELLQESKAFYVKSDCVRDRQQRLQRPPACSSSPPCSPVSGTVGAAPLAAAAPVPAPMGPMGLSSALLSPPPSPVPMSSPCTPLGAEPMPPAPPGFQEGTSAAAVSPSPRSLLMPKSPRLGLGHGSSGSAGTTWAQRRAASQQLQSDRLQTKLRRLLNADSKENVYYDGGDDEHDDAHTVAGERALSRSYGRSNSQTHQAYSSRTWSNQTSATLHKSLPDLHTSPTPTRQSVPRWSSDNSSNRDSSTSSHSGDGCGYVDYIHRRSGSQRGSRSLHYSGDSMSVVSSGGRTHQSHRSQPAQGPAAREMCGGELRRGGSSGSSSGARTHRSQPEGRSRANTVSEALIRQSSGGSSAALSGMSSWSPRYRSRPTSQYHSMRNTSAEELEGSRGKRGSRGSLGSRGSSQKSDHENYSSPPQCSRVAELCWNFEPRRPILRSKSDISHRYSGSVNVPLSPPCQDPAQLENFFEQLGLDNTEFRYVSRSRSDSSDSPVFFSSVSSVDSNNGGWNAPWSAPGSGLATSVGGTTGTPGGMMGSGHSGKNIEQPSIVERNARIIKWLCNCRKAQKEMYQALGNGNVT